MGQGLSFKCSKCGKEYSASWGIGFFFPQVYKDLLDNVKKGKYGQEWKELSLSTEYVAVDAEEYVYICKKCGHWVVEPGLSLYAPNDVKTLKKKQYGIKNVEEWGEPPYVMSSDLQEDYHILKRKIHKCTKCSGTMHKAADKELNGLCCPDCGGAPDENADVGIILWD
jgi:DNA-directed RNA polymerase subunit RPC12/RpoP